MEQMEFPESVYRPPAPPATEAKLRRVYTTTEVARWAKTTPQTATRWIHGYTYPIVDGQRRSSPMGTSSHTKGDLLNFEDLVEVAIVAAARQSGMRLVEIRAALETAQDLYGVPRPLLTLRFHTDGKALFFKEGPEGPHVNLNRKGQIAWELIAEVLRAVDYDRDTVARWWPAGRDIPIYIDPLFAFGMPIVLRGGISTSIIAERFLAGESLEVLADDYTLDLATVEAAIRFEHPGLAD
jgi:uncharacterized protein (DUF433 family)